MEAVRKGRGLKPDQEADMKEHGVPEWYLESCKKIQYMFPKAHAAAYVMMAYRIAYCKVNYPLAYYAAFFTIRAKAFSYALMCHGPEKVNHMIAEYAERKKSGPKLSAKEEDTLRDLKIVQEMYARGIEFLPIDIYKSKALAFQIVDGKLLPPFNSIDGMGEKAATLAEEAAQDGPYLSRSDFQKRSKVNGTIMEVMEQEGLFGDLPKDTQLSLFDIDLI
ncbi:MAG: PolC-type DNA polymerase III, partial [Lachnospiraceae bacterium]|nr:PolC-type DNA polymerase III [Lachnospiraceae bacterium]